VAALKGCAFALLLLFVAVIAAPLRLLSLDKRLARVTARTTLPNVHFGSLADIQTGPAMSALPPITDIGLR
jgi:hypothetical protein